MNTHPTLEVPMRRRLFAAAMLVVLTSVTSAVATGASPASADLAQSGVVSDNPVNFTPHVLDGTVWALALVGDTVVVGGSFTKVADSTKRHTYARKNIFAYGLRDGAVRTFAPVVDAAVYALAAGPGDTVYAGGAFKTVNGSTQRGLARLSLVDSSRVNTFRANINWGDVRALEVSGNHLYAGGAFSAINGTNRVALARLNPLSGVLDTGFDARLSAPGLTRTRVEHFDISPDGTRLVAIGALLRSGTSDRTQIAVFDVSGSAATLTGWYTDAYKPECLKGFDTYLRQVKFSPDGRYFVVAATGRMASTAKLCDSAARFEIGGSARHNPTWVQRTGGDSLYSVAVTGSAVYVGGHQRYLDNPYGSDTKGAGAGAVSRIGIGAVSPITGRALSWNPTRARGIGVRAFLVTSTGLTVGSDTDQLGHEYHGRIGMFPLA
jgi:WD40 repeat protein